MLRKLILATTFVFATPILLFAEKNSPIKAMLGEPGKNPTVESFDKGLAESMLVVKGEWKVVDGVLVGKELDADMHAAVLSLQRKNRNSLVRFSFKLDGTTSGLHLSLNHEKGHLFRVVVSPSSLSLNLDKDKNDPSSKPLVLDKAQASFVAGKWITLQVEILGDTVVAHTDTGAVVKAQHASLDTDKPNYRFVMKGDSLSIDDVLIADIKLAKANTKKPSGTQSPLSQISDVEGLPRVLLIGDSISIGYTIPVRNALNGKANVHRPPTNCGPTTNGLKSLDAWLGDKQWDVIHFNWGLHDLKFMGPAGENLRDPSDPTSRQQVPPQEYEKNLRQLVARLKKTGAKLIWRNTTPIPAGAAGRIVEDADKYNAIAADIMKENGIEIQDMMSFVKPRQEEIMLQANVHFTKEGYAALAQEVATAIAASLSDKP